MSQIHSWLGLGEMNEDPILIYLARSTSLMYAVHGAVQVFTGLKIERLWPLVWLLGVLHVLIGCTMLFVDLNAGMPTYWTAGEGPPVAGLGLLILYLWNRGEKDKGVEIGLRDPE